MTAILLTARHSSAFSIVSLTWLLLLIVVANGNVLQEISTERQPQPLNQQDSSMTFSLTLETPAMETLAGLANLGTRSSFRYANRDVSIPMSPKGIRRVRLIQTFAGYDVFGSSVEAEVNSQDQFTGQMYGEVVKNIHRQILNPEACKRSGEYLQNLAIRLEDLNPNNVNVTRRDARRIVYAGPGLAKAKLAYKVEFFYAGTDKPKRPVYYIDACTRLVLLSFDRIRMRFASPSTNNSSLASETVTPSVNKNKAFMDNSTISVTGSTCRISADGVGGNEKIGRIRYNDAPFCLNVQRNLFTCTMEGSYVKVIDNEQRLTPSKRAVAQFRCGVGYSDAINGAYGVANDALFYGEISGRFFEENYNYRPFSYKPRLVVHYGIRYQNAFWDGTDTFYGDGANILHPFVDIDTVAHELGHGIITRNSDLVYRGMAGGINEAFADIVGETTKHFLRNSNDWLVSYDVVKESAGFVALRYFEDPTLDGNSIKSVYRYYPTMDVHFSSGVFNHAFYLMVVEERMDIYDAFKCFHDANLNLWKPFTNFFSGACNVMQAAYDNGFNHRKVRRAFRRVGIPLIFCRYSYLSTSVLVGETRENILVSTKRSPILKIDLKGKKSTPNKFVKIEAQSESEASIRMGVGKDDEVSRIIAVGENTMVFDSSKLSSVYIQLACDSPTDVSVSLKVI